MVVTTPSTAEILEVKVSVTAVHGDNEYLRVESEDFGRFLLHVPLFFFGQKTKAMPKVGDTLTIQFRALEDSVREVLSARFA
ncbi:MAG: hypothetical protein WC444_03270 [Candidatus Paceibacterota bacterium]